MKPKECAVCGNEFIPFKSTEKVCSVDCAIEWAKSREKKRYKAKTREMRREYKLKDRGYQTKLAQHAFNKYIRVRDAGKPCISCGRNTGAKMNAGHYLTVGGHPELRFEPVNCHLQCEHCNSFLSGNIARYRINLIAKIGINKLRWLEGPHNIPKKSIDELIEAKELFIRMRKNIEQARLDGVTGPIDFESWQ